MNDETIREAFEKWAEPNGFDLRKLPDKNTYGYWRTHEAWVGWKAACEWMNTRAQASAPEGSTNRDEISSKLVDAPEGGDFDSSRFEKSPCYLCGYNGKGYYQPCTHPCASRYHDTRNAKAGEMDADTEDAVVAAMLAYAERCDDALHTEDLRDVEAHAQRLGLIAFKRSLKGALSTHRGDDSTHDKTKA